MIEQALIKTLGFGVKEFVEKAIEGGWITLHYNNLDYSPSVRVQLLAAECSHEILLDPFAWQAVGKVEGWTGIEADKPNSKGMMLGMVKALWEDKTIALDLTSNAGLYG